MTNPRALLLAASVAVGVTVPAGPAAAATSSCKLVKIAELPVRVLHDRLVVEGAINGQAINIMVDTGATVTLIPRPTADRLGLSRQKIRGQRMFGIGGESDVESTLVDEFKIGDAAAKARRMMVTGERDLGDGIAVILGEDFFRAIDVEFDLAHNAIRLFQPRDCDGASLAYWATQGASEVPIERVGEVNPSIVLTVQVNGQPVRALLDSGAGASVLDRPDATRLGVIAEAPGAAAGKGSGLGPQSVDTWIGSVNSFTVGGESIKDTTILVAELSKGLRHASTRGLAPTRVGIDAAMLLGADFLRAHRLLVAHSQQKLYFTYAGGPVFQRAEPAKSGSTPESAIAEYDAAIRSNPQDPEAYFHRANAWYEKKEYDRAIADYDASIRINPGRASAYSNRAGAKLAKGDYVEGAADATRAIGINPGLAPAYLIRGNAKRRTGDLGGAIADYTRAIEIDPKLASAYNTLAWVLATAERPAVRDGRRALELARNACDLTQWTNAAYIDTLAAAYARAGNFEEATKWQRKSMENPRTANDDKATERLRLYEQGKAWPAD